MTAREWIVALSEDRRYSVPAALYESDIAAIQADAERAGEKRGVRKVQEEIDTLKSALNNSLAELHALKAKLERYEKALHKIAITAQEYTAHVAGQALEEPK